MVARLARVFKIMMVNKVAWGFPTQSLSCAEMHEEFM
jgi:hypothetical protein